MNWSSGATFTRRIAVSGAALALIVAPAAARAQRNACSIRRPLVDAVGFTGNRAIPTGELAPLVATERTGIFRRWFGWNVGPETCLDSLEVATDERRIKLAYAMRGYPGTAVHAQITHRGARRAQVKFEIHEAAPVLVRTVLVLGLPHDGADSVALRARLSGGVMSDSVVRAVADSVHEELRNHGYARARPAVIAAHSDTAKREATVTITFAPGRVTRIGPITVSITASGGSPALHEGDVRALLRLKSGDVFSAQRVGTSQRDLYALELYRSIKVDTGTAQGQGAGSTAGAAAPTDTSAADSIPIVVTLIEGDRWRVRIGGGWGTLDCFRTQARFVEQNFLALGHRLELNGRVSKIGVGEPFSGLKEFCAPRLRDDAFSQQLGYYAGASANLRGLLGTGYRPEVTVFSERRSEIGAYEQTTDIGLLAAVGRELAPRLEGRVQYTFVNATTTADRAVSCTKFGFCRLEDVASFILRSPQHGVTLSLTRNPLLPTDDPVRGMRWQVEAKYGHAKVGQIVPLDFGRFQGEFALYRPLNWLFVVAMRVQAGTIIAPADRSFLLPPPERFYGGGQNSVRGYDQNLLGPGSYIVTAFDTVAGPGGEPVGQVKEGSDYHHIAPSGGNAMWLANLELRTTRGWPNDLLRWVLFVDAGRVWNTHDVFSVTNAAARVTPGIGARLATPLGPFRADIGFNPNPLEAGPAFFVQPADPRTGTIGRAICVSPGSDDPVGVLGGTSPSAASCPATFLPVRPTTLLSRLTFHFSLGHAF